MLVTSSYQGRYAAHIVQHFKDGGNRVLSSQFCMSGEKAMKHLLETTEEEVWKKMYGYGGLRVQSLRK